MSDELNSLIVEILHRLRSVLTIGRVLLELEGDAAAFWWFPEGIAGGRRYWVRSIQFSALLMSRCLSELSEPLS